MEARGAIPAISTTRKGVGSVSLEFEPAYDKHRATTQLQLWRIGRHCLLQRLLSNVPTLRGYSMKTVNVRQLKNNPSDALRMARKALSTALLGCAICTVERSLRRRFGWRFLPDWVDRASRKSLQPSGATRLAYYAAILRVRRCRAELRAKLATADWGHMQAGKLVHRRPSDEPMCEM